MNGLILLQAGHETTASLITLGTVALLQHPDAFDLAGRTDDAGVTANIVEELMRYLTIVHSQVDRLATEDFSLGGASIRARGSISHEMPAAT
jgi:cytochrome P450